MSDLKEKLQTALDAKKNDINSFVWKFEKEKTANGFAQKEIKLVDATEEQLNEFYDHCITMLYNNKDAKKIGRCLLIDLIKEQRTKCNAMLFINWIAAHGQNGNPYPRHIFFQDMRNFLDSHLEEIPRDTWDIAKITAIMPNIPVEFNSLTIQMVYDACLDNLGAFDRRHITNNFIVKMGLWFTKEELQDLTVKDDNGKTMNRLDVIRQRCDLKPGTNLYDKLHIDQKGLTYKEFRAMKNLTSRRYSELTTDQLTILRDKILFKLEEEVNNHIKQWKDRMSQIEKVAESKGINIIKK